MYDQSTRLLDSDKLLSSYQITSPILNLEANLWRQVVFLGLYAICGKDDMYLAIKKGCKEWSYITMLNTNGAQD